MDNLPQKDTTKDMIHFNLKNKPAFTMIELVFVIVVLGILAALALPRMERDQKQEGADAILSQIRYTQHLALLDDKHLYTKKKWQRRFWQIMFTTCNGQLVYRLGSDDDMNSTSTFSENEAATDPINGKPLYGTNANCNTAGTNPNVLLGKKYGVSSMSRSGGCAGQYIGFDHLGRPHSGFSATTKTDYASYMKTECIFTFTMSDGDTFKIKIEPETGYAFIDGQTGS